MSLNNSQLRCVSRITEKSWIYMCIKNSDVMSGNRRKILFLSGCLARLL